MEKTEQTGKIEQNQKTSKTDKAGKAGNPRQPEKPGRVITFGELMLRLAPPERLRLFQKDLLETSFGGAEANVAVSLACLGREAAFVTRLPDNELGRAAEADLRSFGVNTGKIVWGGSRMGIYFVEPGASQRPSKVIYDRARSAVSEAVAGDFCWAEIFRDASWFHFSGITPALGENVAEICMEACKAAAERGITVSCDLNFRKKLWTEEEAGRIMAPLMELIDVCIANEEDAEKVFGIKTPRADAVKGILPRDGCRRAAEELRRRFSFTFVAMTLRASRTADDNRWEALLLDEKGCCFSESYDIHVVDRFGGGDAFAAGLIYGLSENMNPREAVEFAAAASCLKHTIKGDYNRTTVEEVRQLMAGDRTGRVQR